MNKTKTLQKLWMALISLAMIMMANFVALAEEPASATNAAKATVQEAVLNNGGVIELKGLGLGDKLIISKIQNSRCEFDTSIPGLKQLKAAGLSEDIITAMVEYKPLVKVAATATAATLQAESGDPNDPQAAHEEGIWFYEEIDGKPKMTKLEPSVYGQNKTGVAFFAQFGETMKNRAVIRGAHAEFEVTNRKPVFYFYFERTSSGLGQSQNIATSPNEYTLSQFEVNEQTGNRSLVMSQMNVFAGGEHGADSKSVRAFSYQKLSPGVYKVTPKEDLANGEFGFFYGGNTGGGKVFDFGVKGSPETEPVVPVVEKPKQTEKKPFTNPFKKKTLSQDAGDGNKETDVKKVDEKGATPL